MTISITSPTSTTSKIQQNGNDVLTVDSSNNVTVINNLSVSGTVTASGNINFDSNTLYVDATNNNVGIGTSSPSNTLTVSFNANAQKWAQFLNTSAGSSSTGGLLFGNDSNGAQASMFVGSGTYGSYGGANSLNLGTFGGGAVTFFTSATERMRIDSSGNFLVGTTTGLDGGNGATIKQASYYISSYRVSTTTGNYIHAFYSDVGGTATAKYAIYANGTAGAISDERYKKNIEPARNYLDDLTKINVIKYNWATDDENAPKELGFSAQQVETIFPALVDTVDNKDADGNVLLNQKILKRDVFVPMLVKAIQEQQEQIKALETRIQALENPS